MGTIMKMMYSIVSMVLKLTWKIFKFLSKPMRDGFKDIVKASRSICKERKEKKAASAASSNDNASNSESTASSLGESGSEN